MAGEGANLAAGTARTALEVSLTASSSGFSFLLRIDNPILAGIALTGAMTLGVFYLQNRQSVKNAIRNALEENNENGADPEVRNIESGSIIVELYCYTNHSLLKFVDDFEAQKVKHRLEEEFTKIGFKRELQVIIRNKEEAYKKVQEIRASLLQEPSHAGQVQETQFPKPTPGQPYQQRKQISDPSLGKGLIEADLGAEANFTAITRDSGGQLFYDEQEQVTVTVSSQTGDEEVQVVDCKDGNYRVCYKPKSVGRHDIEIRVNGWPLTYSPWKVEVKPHQYKVVRWSGSGELNRPFCIAKNEITGDIAVADYFNRRVQVFNKDMKHMKTIIGGKADSQRSANIGCPVSVAFSKSNDIMVTHEQLSPQNKKLSLLTDHGIFIEHFSEHLIKAHHVSVKNDDGHVIVCDEGDKKVKVISPDGKELLLAFSAPDSKVLPSFPYYYRDRFFVSYMEAHCVKVFGKDGVFLYNIGSEGSGEGQLRYPEGLSVDSFGNLIVCDVSSIDENVPRGILKMFTLDGTFLTSFGEDMIKAPWIVSSCNNGDLLVADVLGDTVYILS